METAEGPAAEGSEESSDEKTPEEILEAEAGEAGEVEEVRDLSTEEIADAEEAESESDAVSEADAREETIELENDAVDSLVNESQEVSDEGIDNGWARTWLADRATHAGELPGSQPAALRIAISGIMKLDGFQE